MQHSVIRFFFLLCSYIPGKTKAWPIRTRPIIRRNVDGYALGVLATSFILYYYGYVVTVAVGVFVDVGVAVLVEVAAGEAPAR